MRKWSLFLMLAVMLAAPMLACGFPLPAGTQTMAVEKAVCAETETAESCQARQDAYQLMGQLQSASVEDLTMAMIVNDGETNTEVNIKGSFDYVATDSVEGLGANVYARLDEGTMVDEDGTESLSGAEFVIIGDTGYSTEDGGATWNMETLDEESLQGLGFILGLGGIEGASMDMFSDPTTFTVTVGEPVEMNGQMMQVQTLTVDLTKLFLNAEALGGLLQGSMEAGGESMGLSEEDLGGDPAEMAQMAGMLLPFLTGTSFSTTLYIGADDGYIHSVQDNYVFAMDMSAFDPETPAMNMSYTLSGQIVNHNGAITIEAPTGATEGGGLFGDSGLFGSAGDVGGGLFGE
ncbi:MAG: hypothetical protein GX573_06345 [Chloroflexi bacterium]|nr:hypothetical protein [Chloroflexota bacterium]